MLKRSPALRPDGHLSLQKLNLPATRGADFHFTCLRNSFIDRARKFVKKRMERGSAVGKDEVEADEEELAHFCASVQVKIKKFKSQNKNNITK